MATEISITTDLPGDDIKQVPDDASMRQAVRNAAGEIVHALDRTRSLDREALERLGDTLLERLNLPRRYLGFAMVALSNEFWRPHFEAIPFSRRLFLLPHCLSDHKACTGTYDSIGLNCAACGSCDIHDLKREAESLGYSVIVAEGTSSVLMKVVDGEADAIFGVACLDSLEKSFERIVELGVPHLAEPLLKNGCLNTEADIGRIRMLLKAKSSLPQASTTLVVPRSYLPLLRETKRMFSDPMFSSLLAPCIEQEETDDPSDVTMQGIAFQWLRTGGKRLRPFVTIAAYLTAKHGVKILSLGEDISNEIPQSIRRLALAIESLHKASLVHDDIEDDDEYRYGQITLHRKYGVGQAINLGDFLIGAGYRLIAGETAALGAECIGDILARLSQAHLELCRGQGAELPFLDRPAKLQGLAEVMKIYAQKTSPAFEAAIYTGLRAADATIDLPALRSFATYVGEGFQIRNDLEDWQEGTENKRKRGLDALAERPTLLRAFAAENGGSSALEKLTIARRQLPPDEWLEQLRQLYCRTGAFEKVENLYRKLRGRALQIAEEFSSADIRELMQSLVRIVLHESIPSQSVDDASGKAG
jgi:geranylgeranyl pyrophosphate synthase